MILSKPVEIWKTIVNFEDYQVSNLGRVRSLKYGKEKILKPQLLTSGYYGLRLVSRENAKSVKIHRLVAEAFIPNPNNYPCINHKDENRLNNEVYNLEWCTYSFNINYGNRNYKSSKKLGRKIVQVAKNGELIKQWDSITEASRILGINRENIQAVLRGKHYTAGGYGWRYVC